jgi:hypothetical protein
VNPSAAVLADGSLGGIRGPYAARIRRLVRDAVAVVVDAVVAGWSARLALGGVRGPHAARIRRLVRDTVAVVVDAVVAGRPACLALQGVRESHAAGIDREIRESVAFVVETVGALRDADRQRVAKARCDRRCPARGAVDGRRHLLSFVRAPADNGTGAGVDRAAVTRAG